MRLRALLAPCFTIALFVTAAAATENAPSPSALPALPALSGTPAQVPLDDPAAVRALEALPLPRTVARPRPAATPLLADLFDVLDRQDAAVAALQTELARIADPMAALALQRRIEKAKQDAEIDVLRVQARHARAAGKAALAAQLDAAIGELTAPRAVNEPVARPAPTRDEAR